MAFENGRTWDVAKIAGSWAYLETMDSVFRQPDHVEMVYANPPLPPDAPIEFVCGTPMVELFSSDPVPIGMGLQPLYDLLPTWLGGHRPDRATTALTDMLLALKTATESALETPINEAYLTVPYPAKDRFHTRLNFASTSVGLKKVHTFETAQAAARAYGAGGGCNLNPDRVHGLLGKEQSVLVLDHNRAKLTATLAAVDCVYSERRILSTSEFGARGLSRPDAWDDYGVDELEACRLGRHNKLVGALHRLTDSPVKGFGDTNLTQIDHIMIVGDSAGDFRLENALKEVHGSRFDGMMRSAYDKYSDLVDPLYAAAEYAAQSSLNNTSIQVTREL